MAVADLFWEKSIVDWLLVADLREKYCWLVTDKPNEQAHSSELTGYQSFWTSDCLEVGTRTDSSLVLSDSKNRLEHTACKSSFMQRNLLWSTAPILAGKLSTLSCSLAFFFLLFPNRSMATSYWRWHWDPMHELHRHHPRGPRFLHQLTRSSTSSLRKHANIHKSQAPFYRK
jgi:hypothetical protein